MINFWTVKQTYEVLTDTLVDAILRCALRAERKGRRERYIQLNAEFQRIAGRDKKAFLSEQCSDREESKRVGKTRDPFKKIGDSQGTFHTKMGTIKDRNGKDLTEAEEIKKWQEYTEELLKKVLMIGITTMVWSLT